MQGRPATRPTCARSRASASRPRAWQARAAPRRPQAGRGARAPGRRPAAGSTARGPGRRRRRSAAPRARPRRSDAASSASGRRNCGGPACVVAASGFGAGRGDQDRRSRSEKRDMVAERLLPPGALRRRRPPRAPRAAPGSPPRHRGPSDGNSPARGPRPLSSGEARIDPAAGRTVQPKPGRLRSRCVAESAERSARIAPSRRCRIQTSPGSVKPFHLRRRVLKRYQSLARASTRGRLTLAQ